MKGKIIGILLVLGLCFSLFSCGKNELAEVHDDEETNYETEKDSNAAYLNEALETQTADSENDLSEIDIVVYTIGSDKVHISISGDECEKFIFNEDGTVADYSVNISFESDTNIQVSANTDSGRLEWDNEGNRKSVSVKTRDGAICCTAGAFSIEFVYEDIAKIFKDGMKATVTFPNNNGDNRTEMLNGKTVVADIDEAKLRDVCYQETLDVVPKTVAHDIWSGTYIFSTYDSTLGLDSMGIADIKITDKGAINISLKSGSAEYNYVFFEQDYTMSDYTYYTYETGYAYGLGSENKGYLQYSHSTNERNPYLNLYSPDINDGYSINLKPAKNEVFKAPKDYVDKDPCGNLDAAMADPYFSPKGDDYLFTYKYSTIQTMSLTYDDDEIIFCDETSMYEFDKNDMCISYKMAYYCRTEKEAKMLVKEYQKANDVNMYEKYGDIRRSGTTVYLTFNGYYNSRKNILDINTFGFNFYEGMHYATYDDQYTISGNNMAYISKPKSETEYTTYDILNLSSFSQGAHSSFESADIELIYHFTPDYSSGIRTDLYVLDFSDKSVGDAYYNDYGEGTLKYLGDNKFVRMNYYCYPWDNEYGIFVWEYELATDKTSVKQYYFESPDENLESLGVTFDNYMLKTPTKIISNTFDMLGTSY